MNSTTTVIDGVALVRLEGTAGPGTTGDLYDMLVAVATAGHRKLILEVSGLARVTRAGLRGVVVAAYLTRRLGGAMRICGAGPALRDELTGLGQDYLICLDDTLEASFAVLCPGSRRRQPFAVPGPNDTAPANGPLRLSA